MEQQRVDMVLMSLGKYFESYQLASVSNQLTKMDDSKFIVILSADLKDPTTALIISIVGGGLGIAKLLTCGGFGIWTLVDWFIIQGRTRELNMERLQRVIM